jgi:hypothetical protein
LRANSIGNRTGPLTNSTNGNPASPLPDSRLGSSLTDQKVTWDAIPVQIRFNKSFSRDLSIEPVEQTM